MVELLNSNYIQRQIDNIKSAQSTNQTELGINNLMRIKLPLPSIEIQSNIIDAIKKKRKKLDFLFEESKTLRENSIKDFEKVIFN